MSTGNGSNTGDASLVAGMELGRVRALLEALLAEARAELLEVAVADVQARELVLDQFPVPGAKRAIAYRTGSGADVFAVPTTGVLVLQANESRLGGTIVNSGANAVLLYLTNTGAATPGRPAIWLAASGGSWDFRLGNILWSGSVSAVAQVSASTLSVAEV